MTGSRPKRTSADEQAAFDRALTRALTGEGVSVHAGLDRRTTEAMAILAGRSPNPPQEFVDAVYEAFAGQLDGSNAREEAKLPWFMRWSDDDEDPPGSEASGVDRLHSLSSGE